MDLTDVQRSALETIAWDHAADWHGRRVIIATEDAEARAGPGMIAELVGMDLAEHGGTPERPIIALTPMGAAALKIELREWIHPGENALIEDSRWDHIRAEKDKPPIKLPRVRHEVELCFPELIPDHRPGPAEEVELLLDAETEEPVKLFGMTVPIDRRLSSGRELAGKLGGRKTR